MPEKWLKCIKNIFPMIDLSVIIPIYNTEQYIERCVRSLMEQTKTNGIEYIFINDCTPDNSMRVLAKTIADYPQRTNQIKIINMPTNSGQGVVRRIGMKEAQGEYIIHCDSDDWIEPNMYDMLINKAKEEDADIVVADFYIEYKNHTEIEKYENLTTIEYIRKGIDCSWWTLWNRVIKRKLIQRYSIYPPKSLCVWEDVYILTIAYYYAKNIAYIHNPLYHYNRMNESSTLTSEYRNDRKELILKCEKCIILLQEYFHDKESWIYEHFLNNEDILKQKLNYRDSFLTKDNFDLDKWRKAFPETWSMTKKNPNRKALYKICYWLAMHHISLPLIWHCKMRNI